MAFSALQCSNRKALLANTLPTKPNIILLFADDLGRNDLACYGNDFIETPNLDRMAAKGAQFMQGYSAAPLCSPSRASILTGNNPARINLTEHLHGYTPAGPKQKLVTPRIATGLDPALTTVAEALQTAGYQTAHLGKWHLGRGPSAPANNGFQLAYGGGEEGLPKSFFFPFFNGQPYKDLLADSKPGDYLDDVLTSRAIRFLEDNKTGGPFFMELNFYAPHVPIEAKAELTKKYQEKRVKSSKNGLPENEYAAMVDNIDMNVGRLLETLRQSGLDRNTIVVFTSDNGGLHVREVPAFAKHTPPTTNAPLQGGKGHLYEGGIRSPWIVYAPWAVPAGQRQQLITTDDFFNTCMELAGLPQRSPDGRSMMAAFTHKKEEDKPYFLHFPHYSPQHGKPGGVLIDAGYKLIHWYEDDKLELFHLKTDPGETNNLATQMPKMVQQYKARLDAWKQSVGAKQATINPIYQP